MKAEENPSQKQMRTESTYMGQTPWTSTDAETPKVYSLPSLRTEIPNTLGVLMEIMAKMGFSLQYQNLSARESPAVGCTPSAILM